jgi:hypothetical protein
MVGHVGQAREHVLEVSVGINAPAPAAFNEGINDGGPFSGVGLANEEPVLLSQGRGPDGIFHQVVVDLYPAISPINFQGCPLAQSVINQRGHQRGQTIALSQIALFGA